jgi:hypothetical protein
MLQELAKSFLESPLWLIVGEEHLMMSVLYNKKEKESDSSTINGGNHHNCTGDDR